jgi:hypothetical protein
MATITTTTSDAVTDPGKQRVDVQNDGTLWSMVRRTSGAVGFFYSKNNGTSWTDAGAGSDVAASGNVELSNFYIDQGNFASFCYRTFSGGQDNIFYMYGAPNAAKTTWTWYAPVNAIHSSSGFAGDMWQQMEVITVANPYPTGGSALVVISISGGPYNGYVGWFTNSGGVLVQKGYIYTSGGGSGVNKALSSMDFKHQGDDKQRTTPLDISICNGYGSAPGTTSYLLTRLVWNGSGFTTGQLTISGAAGQADSGLGGATNQLRRVVRIDAQGRALIPHINGTATMALLEVDASRTVKTVRTPLVHPTGIVTAVSVNYDNNGNVYLYAVGTSTNQVYVCTYTRSGNVWGAWTAVGSATSDNAAWGTRRNAQNNRLDTMTQTGAGTFTISHQQTLITANPINPRWDTAITLATNAGSAIVTGGLVANVSSTLPLDWIFIDPDPSDSQSAYAISRQIGVGTLSYWQASTSTWVAAEVQNVSTTSSITLATAWGAGTDANHTYKVKVWDQANLPSGYSDGLVITPSVVVNPTITAPANASAVTTASTTMAWTVAEETKFRVLLERNTGAWFTVSDATVTSTVLSYELPNLANGGSYRVTLYTANNEGLWTAGTTNTFTVSYTPPNTPTLTFPALDPMYNYIIAGQIANPGGGISVTTNDVERRENSDDSTIMSLETGVAVNGIFYDARIKSGVLYQYRITAYGSNSSAVTTSWIG